MENRTSRNKAVAKRKSQKNRVILNVLSSPGENRTLTQLTGTRFKRIAAAFTPRGQICGRRESNPHALMSATVWESCGYRYTTSAIKVRWEGLAPSPLAGQASKACAAAKLRHHRMNYSICQRPSEVKLTSPLAEGAGVEPASRVSGRPLSKRVESPIS